MGPVTMTAGGEEIVFRVPVMKDVLRLDGELPLLPGDEKDDEATDHDKTFERMAKDPKRLLRFLERADSMLCTLAIKPRLVREYKLEPDEGTKPIDSLKDQDKVFIYLALTGMSGYNDEAAVEIGPLSATGDHSDGSMPSASDTGSDPASSSAPN